MGIQTLTGFQGVFGEKLNPFPVKLPYPAASFILRPSASFGFFAATHKTK
jgi:hypothetical protein